jgi:hypothetical protein
LLFAGFYPPKLARKSLEQKDVRHILTIRLRSSNPVWCIASDIDTDTYGFDGSNIEIMAKCTSSNRECFELMLDYVRVSSIHLTFFFHSSDHTKTTSDQRTQILFCDSYKLERIRTSRGAVLRRCESLLSLGITQGLKCYFKQEQTQTIQTIYMESNGKLERCLVDLISSTTQIRWIFADTSTVFWRVMNKREGPLMSAESSHSCSSTERKPLQKDKCLHS